MAMARSAVRACYDSDNEHSKVEKSGKKGTYGPRTELGNSKITNLNSPRELQCLDTRCESDAVLLAVSGTVRSETWAVSALRFPLQYLYSSQRAFSG